MKDAHIKNLEFYRGRRVLVTGHTGFKGAWLTSVLNYMKADALGYALAPAAESLYSKIDGDWLIHNVTGDLLDREKLRETVLSFSPEIVLHLGAFALVKDCYYEPARAYGTNLMGSLNLLEALRECDSVKSIVMVSTDKVYRNHGDGAVYKETAELGGHDAYSNSKTCMELLTEDYRTNYFLTRECPVGIATVRASNVLAGGDHIPTRLIPSILKAVSDGTDVELRNPTQTRPWQSVLDALNGYLTVARYLHLEPAEYSGAWNIGPTLNGIRTVSWVFNKIQQYFNGLEYHDGERLQVAESETLGLDIQKVLGHLDWEPRLSCERTVEQVVDFFKAQQAGEWEREICMRQIAQFLEGIE